MRPISFNRHRFPPDVNRQAVWLYFRFTLSLRDVEELLTARGVDVSYEIIRCWVMMFGTAITANIRRARPKADSTWHLDEMVVRITVKNIVGYRFVSSSIPFLLRDAAGKTVRLASAL